VVEHRLVVVLVGDDDEPVPGARVENSVVLDLCAEALGVGDASPALYMRRPPSLPRMTATSSRVTCVFVRMARAVGRRSAIDEPKSFFGMLRELPTHTPAVLR
jgi:hypothetical protein